ncbi:DoxX family protein [Candidatus Woesearchaeota archaeon]|nr:DoxX family protein [Candidatus Woesearchaeota archaeon]
MLKNMCEKYTDHFYFLMRVIVGYMFFLHGLQKFGMLGGPGIDGFAGFMAGGDPTGLFIFFAYIVAIVETVGGLFIALGVMTRLAAGLGAITMLVAFLWMHLSWNPLASGGEAALLYLVIFLVLKTKGPGKWALMKKEVV